MWKNKALIKILNAQMIENARKQKIAGNFTAFIEKGLLK